MHSADVKLSWLVAPDGMYSTVTHLAVTACHLPVCVHGSWVSEERVPAQGHLSLPPSLCLASCFHYRSTPGAWSHMSL